MAMMHLFILVIGVPSALIFAQGQVTINVPAVGFYGEDTHMNCQGTNLTIPFYYRWFKNDEVFYESIVGEVDSTGKYTGTTGTGIVSLTIRNTELDDAGVYACQYDFYRNSSRLDIEAKGSVTAELSSSSSGKLEVTFKNIYPSEISVVITCDSSYVNGAFVTNVPDGTLFTRKWESSTVLSSKPSACSARVTLRTTFTIHFDVISGAQTEPFSKQVDELFAHLNDVFGISDCISIAKNKFGNSCSDKNYAKALINLYTQECELDIGGTFYSVLNREMRENTVNYTWQQSGKLINMALDILNPRLYPKVYRGCSVNIEVPRETETYSFNQITSTSLKSSAADQFCGLNENTSFIIKNAYGVSIDNISDLSSEKEFLMKSTEKFTVERKDGNKITLVRKASRRKKRSSRYQSCITSDAGSAESNMRLLLPILFLSMLFGF